MADPSVNARWLSLARPNPQARLRLICFPYAGGGGSVFRTWVDGLPITVEVCAIHLPGRGSRITEPPFTELLPLVQALSRDLLPYLTDKPCAFFGHSMGALIGFELIRELRRQRARTPLHLFVSGRGAPHIPNPDPPIHDLPETEFVAELRRFNGTPKEVLEHPELMQLLIPALRADFAVCETYSYTVDAPLDCPISAFGGLDDHDVSRDRLEAWGDQSSASFSLRMFRGNHFFLHTVEQLLLQIVAKVLRQVEGTL